MRKLIILLVVSMVIPIVSLGDTAPVMPVQSGCVVPVKNDFVEMQSEIVIIRLFRSYYEVEVEYYFRNTGARQNVTMGFPNQTSSEFTETIKNFEAFCNDSTLAITEIFEAADTTKPESVFIPKKFYECFNVFFEKDETLKIRNTYTQWYVSDYHETFRRAEYILTTGALWKNTIGNIKVYVYPQGIPAEELKSRTAFIKYEYDDSLPTGKINMKALSLLPDSFTLIGGNYFAEFKNIDPDFDIEINMPPVMQRSFSASSVLASQDTNTYYNAYNVNDNNPNTAWAEGKEGDGIGETIDINILAGDDNVEQSFYKIQKIGFMNGINKSQDLFAKNNRVKRLKILYYEPFIGSQKELEVTLDDSMGMQYFSLPQAEYVSSLSFVIQEVYKGTQYDNTCISEISIIPVE
ncbi:MAG: hypothetical protein V1904_08310 [Bacteroidota bacterium]